MAFLTWYMIEINSSVTALAPLIQPTGNIELQIVGFVLGLLIATLAIGGIRLIRWTCVIGLPLMLFFVIYLNIGADYHAFSFSWGFSFSAIISVIAINLPGAVNLPTFFRHSNSRA